MSNNDNHGRINNYTIVMEKNVYLIICGVATTFYNIFNQLHLYAHVETKVRCVANITYGSEAKHNKYLIKCMWAINTGIYIPCTELSCHCQLLIWDLSFAFSEELQCEVAAGMRQANSMLETWHIWHYGNLVKKNTKPCELVECLCTIRVHKCVEKKDILLSILSIHTMGPFHLQCQYKDRLIYVWWFPC